MSVSQWFVQWSPPPVLFADLAQNFGQPQSYGVKAETYSPFRQSAPQVKSVSQGKYGYSSVWKQNAIPVYSDFGSELPSRDGHTHNGQTQLSALTLWLALMGVAQPQSVPADTETPPFNTLYKWRQVDFEFPSPRHRSYALATGQYIPENVLPLGLEVWGSRVWVTLPSWRRGVPATLATVPRAGGLPSPPLKPYPDWGFHRAFGTGANCSGLTSVFRINADPCGRLWVLDSGQIDSQDDPKQICPPSIVVFDLNTDRLIARYPIPDKYVLQNSLFSTIIVDTHFQDCSDLHLYIADTWRFGLLVFRLLDKSFWRFSHHLFYPDPLASNYTLHGINYQWPDGLFGLALSPVNRNQGRVLFFHAMSSYREFYVSTSILRDPERVNNSATDFHIAGESRGLFGQSSASAVDKRGVLFYGLVSKDSVGCWDSKKPYLKRNLDTVATNTETLIFPNDIKVDQEERQSVWVISNRLPLYQAGPLDPGDYHYRLLYADAVEAARGTACDPDLPPRPGAAAAAFAAPHDIDMQPGWT